MATALFINAGTHLLVAAVFVVVGVKVLQRQRDHVALQAFSLWWFLYAVQSAITGARVVNVGLGNLDPDVYEGLFLAENTFSVLALWGLAAYVQFLYHGRPRYWMAWGVVVLALTAFYNVVVTTHDIVAVSQTAWGTDFEFATPLPAWQQFALVLSYYGILVGLAISLARIAQKVDDRGIRFRTWSLLAALTTLSLAGLLGLGLQLSGPVRIVMSLLRIPAALLVLWAYAPPAWLRDRFEIPP